MEVLESLITTLLPAGAVLYGMFLVVKSFLGKELNKNLLELKSSTVKVALPLRLQAYERLALFLERTAPNNLIRRLMDSSFNVVQFQHFLVNEVRNEFEHNLSQQIYMSDGAWDMVRRATEETVTIINAAAEELKDDAPCLELGKKIFEVVSAQKQDPNEMALRFIKNEIRDIF
jgi:hypothetical protein